MLYNLLLNSMAPISDLTCFATIAKRFDWPNARYSSIS